MPTDPTRWPRFCILLNSLTPKATTEVEGPLEYAQNGYETGEQALSQYRPHISLQNSTVLDAGCGLGGKTVFLSEQGTRYVVGADIDLAHVRHARRFAEKKNADHAGFVAADLSALPLAPESLDMILLNDVVEHVRRPILEETFRQCRRALKPGGRICAQFPPWSCYNASHLFPYVSIPWSHLLFSEETLVRVTEHYEPEPRFGSLSYVEHFRQLNRIELDEFLEIVDECGLIVLSVKRRMIKGIDILERLPILCRYLTTRIIAVLTREPR